MEKALCLFCDDRFLQFDGLDFLEIVGAVHLPPPIVQKADVEGVGGAVEGTAHAHVAVVVELEVAFFVHFDVVHRAQTHALAALHTLVLVNFVQERVDVASDVHRFGDGPSDQPRPPFVRLHIGNAVLYFVHQDVVELFILSSNVIFVKRICCFTYECGRKKTAAKIRNYMK